MSRWHPPRSGYRAHTRRSGQGRVHMRLFSGAVFVGLAFRWGEHVTDWCRRPVRSPGRPCRYPDTNIAPEGLPELLAVDVGHHDTFDRVVFRFSSWVPGYNVNYVPEVTADPSDEPVPLEGNAFMIVAMHSVASGQVGAPPAPQDRQTPRFPELREIAGAGDFEGVVSFGPRTHHGVRVPSIHADESRSVGRRRPHRHAGGHRIDASPGGRDGVDAGAVRGARRLRCPSELAFGSLGRHARNCKRHATSESPRRWSPPILRCSCTAVSASEAETPARPTAVSRSAPAGSPGSAKQPSGH